MLTVRREQMQAFEQASVRRFENHVIQQLRENDPALCEGLGEERLQNTVSLGVNRSRTVYLLSLKQKMFILGSHFDQDPQFPELATVLQDPAHGESKEKVAALFRQAQSVLQNY